MRKSLLKIGCDPELFLMGADRFISAHGMLSGTKEKPLPVPHGALQIDGTAVEFNIDPAVTVQEFVDNIESVMKELKNRFPQFSLAPVPVAHYTPEYFYTIPESARELGCNPDFDAWTGEMNIIEEVENTTFRTGSGHIHLGWGEDFDVFSEEHFYKCMSVVRQLDYYLGMYTLLWDPDPTRRKLYGKAGAFRPKPYGVEYRVPSNAWLAKNITTRFVFNAVQKAWEDLEAGKIAESAHGDIARHLINENVVSWEKDYGDFGTGLAVPAGIRTAASSGIRTAA